MNPQIPIEARQTVLDFITAGTSFTAYEVTLEVRRRLGTAIDVPHNVVNGIVQTMFAGGEIIGYDRRPDATVPSTTPPFRYYQRGGGVAAPFVAPTAPAISRSNLPAALRFLTPFHAIIRNYGIAARDFQRAAGKADEPFAVWLPTLKTPTFRWHCYGAGWNQSEIEKLFTLDLMAPGDADLIWLSALAYTDEFRLYSNLNGTQFQYLIAMDAALKVTATRETERKTGEPDGLEIEVAVRNRDINLGARAQRIYRCLTPAPNIYSDGTALRVVPSKTFLAGEGWALTDANQSAAIVDSVIYPLNSLSASGVLAGVIVDFTLDAGDVDIQASHEGLEDSAKTNATLLAAIARLKSEVAVELGSRFESAANLWQAKSIYGEVKGQSRNIGNAIFDLANSELKWRDIPLSSGEFRWDDTLTGVAARKYLPSGRPDKPVFSTKTQNIVAHPKTLVFINDLDWGKSATSRIAELYRTDPFEVATVLSFEDEAARANFFREQNFETVPTRLISELPKPTRAQNAPRATNRQPFDAQLHQIKAPQGGVAASFASGNDGSDDDFAKLKKWAQTTPLDEKNWPDFKRLYKAIEARLWPPMGRFRWDKTEADFPAAPVPHERDLEMLGVLMGRLDEINAARGAVKVIAPQLTIAQRAINVVSNLVGGANAATSGGPSDDTLAYMKRRAAKLLVFLRDHKELSAARREALAPLVSGLLQRDKCADINATLPLRLKLTRTDVLAAHPDAIARVWADATLPINIARWSYDWLEEHGQIIAVSPAQLRRFVELGDVDWTLKLAPAALQNNQSWPRDFGLPEFSRALQGNLQKTANNVWINTAFLQRRGEIINLFARSPQLQLDKRWLRDSLLEVSDEVTLDWLAPWLSEWARDGEFALLEKMSLALQNRFNAAIVAAHPDGFSLEKWRELSDSPALLPLLSPALRALPISPAIADFIWALPADKRDPILSALEDNPALLPIIETHARRLDWAFIAPLSARQWEHFARVVGQTFPDGINAGNWTKIAALPFATGYEFLPLGAGFWQFVLPLETDERAIWIERVGARRAGTEFAVQSATVFEELLDSDATGLDALGDSWLDAHLREIPLDSELILKLAQSNVSDWQMRALSYLQSAQLRLPVALRLMESELPLLERVAAPFFRDADKNWSYRVLALADSPKPAARALALQLLQEFPGRWTPDLLRNLAQHDDAGIQAFVAAQLEAAPPKIVESQAVKAFDNAIINARGRARRAKESVKSRLNEGEFDRETLLEAARNGAPRDREWALQQLVLASLAGEGVEDLKLEGAFAKANSSGR